MADHVHILISIPPKYSVAQVVGLHQGQKQKCDNNSEDVFWPRGYYVSTVGRYEETVQNYIRHQEMKNRRIDQLDMF